MSNEEPKLLKEDLVQFWDNLDEDLYSKVQDSRMNVRTNSDRKVKFEESCEGYKGGMTYVINKYMDFHIQHENKKSKTK